MSRYLPEIIYCVPVIDRNPPLIVLFCERMAREEKRQTRRMHFKFLVDTS